MWKLINLAGFTQRQAADRVARRIHRSPSAARGAYYRFTKIRNAADRRTFLVELKRDYLDNPTHWDELAAIRKPSTTR